MLGRLFAFLFAATVVIASALATWIGPAGQTAMAGVDAYDRWGSKTVLREWLSRAEIDDARAKYDLGCTYASNRDERRAAKPIMNWLRNGAVPYQRELDENSEAAFWLGKAEEQGDALAHFNVGLIYYRGQGVSENYAEAVRWFRKAAEQGDAPAQTYLGLMYVLGWGVRKDDIEAYKWWSLAAAKEGQQAQANLKNISRTMTPAQIAVGQKMAREWWARHGKSK